MDHKSQTLDHQQSTRNPEPSTLPHTVGLETCVDRTEALGTSLRHLRTREGGLKIGIRCQENLAQHDSQDQILALAFRKGPSNLLSVSLFARRRKVEVQYVPCHSTHSAVTLFQCKNYPYLTVVLEGSIRSDSQWKLEPFGLFKQPFNHLFKDDCVMQVDFL